MWTRIRQKLKYHRVVILSIVIPTIWITYEYTPGQPSYENGVPKIEGKKVNGKDEGLWTWYYPNGNKQMQGSFKNGKRNGRWMIWDKDGNKLSETYYENDKLNGSYKYFFPDGKIKEEGYYEDDLLLTRKEFRK